MEQHPRQPGDGSKVAGAGWDIPTRELHHWWPKGVSRFWMDNDGQVSRLDTSEGVYRSPPKNFGAINNAHAVKLDGPWNGTIEPIFNFADSHLPGLIAGMLEKLSATVWSSRVLPYSMSASDHESFSEALASLVVRSPGFRNCILLTANHYRGEFQQAEVDVRDNLIALNMKQWYPNIVGDFRRANLGLIYSRDREFIFGDGYLNNISGSSFTSDLRAVIPLTPEIAAIVFSGSGRIPPARICAFAARESDVSSINALTQIYSSQFLYFRRQRPKILPEFKEGMFLQRKHHHDPLIEAIIERIRHADQVMR